ncbi:hypothetical protein [Streptomyces sp. CoT10]|uniref:hypothetical protein n=1 Tax=Streptomyces sp. CoT10 TaxID=2875762 RepID=UPI001CD196A3|nr:hypothetical protein [Streptomyces sp. CoT10]
MVCTRRIVAAAGLAVSVAGLTALPASAPSAGRFQLPGLLDSSPGPASRPNAGPNRPRSPNSSPGSTAYAISTRRAG